MGTSRTARFRAFRAKAWFPAMTAGPLVAMAAFLAAAGPAAAQAIDAAGMKKLAEGGVLMAINADEQGSAALIDAVIDIPVSRHVLWTTMLDCERMKRAVGGLEGCRVIERDPQGSWDVREHIMSWSWLLPNVRSVFRSDFTGEEKISFRRVDGDLAILEGEWRLEPLNGGAATRLYYKTRVGASIPVPAFIIRDALDADVRETMLQLRDEAIRAAAGR